MRFALLAFALSLVVMPTLFANTGSTVPTVDDPAIYVVGISGMT